MIAYALPIGAAFRENPLYISRSAICRKKIGDVHPAGTRGLPGVLGLTKNRKPYGVFRPVSRSNSTSTQ